MKNYKTPLFDAAIQELGYKRYNEEHPVYVNYNSDFCKLKIAFLPHFDEQRLQEGWLSEGKGNIESTKKSFYAYAHVARSNVSDDEINKLVTLLTTDFYWHDRNIDKYKEMYKKCLSMGLSKKVIGKEL